MPEPASAAPPAPAPPAPTRRPGRLRALLPWVLAFGVLAWLFHIVPIGELGRVLKTVPILPFILLTLVTFSGTLITDTFATWMTLRAALPDVPLRYREVLDLRGASYLLAILHYGAGQGGLGYFLNQRHKVDVARVTGLVMMLMGVNVVVVAFFVFVGVVLGGAPADPTLRWIVIALACGFPAYLAVITARPRFLARVKLLQPLFNAGFVGTLRAAAARAPHIGWLIMGNFLAMRLFGVTPPFGQALVLLPMVFIVAVLPITPSGLGSAQIAAVNLLSPFAAGPDPRAAVLAYSLAMQFMGLFVQAAVGLVFLRRVARAGTLKGGPP